MENLNALLGNPEDPEKDLYFQVKEKLMSEQGFGISYAAMIGIKGISAGSADSCKISSLSDVLFCSFFSKGKKTSPAPVSFSLKRFTFPIYTKEIISLTLDLENGRKIIKEGCISSIKLTKEEEEEFVKSVLVNKKIKFRVRLIKESKIREKEERHKYPDANDSVNLIKQKILDTVVDVMETPFPFSPALSKVEKFFGKRARKKGHPLTSEEKSAIYFKIPNFKSVVGYQHFSVYFENTPDELVLKYNQLKQMSEIVKNLKNDYLKIIFK